MKYPLLIQGIFSAPDGTSQQTVAPAVALTNTGWRNTLVKGRGNLVAVDPVTTNSATGTETDLGTFTYFVGSQQVLQDSPITRHIGAAWDRSYELQKIESEGGQSVQLLVTNNASLAGIVMHHYYENQYRTREIVQARFSAQLSQRVKSYRINTFAGGARSVGGTNVIPTGVGNVVGVELFCTRGTASVSDVQNSLLTLIIDGVEIFKDVASAIFLSASGRPSLIFPILIRGGSTWQLNVNNAYAAGAAPVLTYYVRFYFDDDRSGNQIYPLAVTSESGKQC